MKMRALVAAFLLALCAPARADMGCGPTNPNCLVPTAPAGTSNNRAASTAFVQSTVSANSWSKPVQGTGVNATATAFSAASQALFLSGTLTGTGQGPYGLFSITDTATNMTGGFVPGFWIAHNVGVSAGEGSRQALQPILTINNPLPCTSGGTYCFHIAAFPQTYVGANLGGTSGAGNSRGDVYGLGGLAQLASGATYVHGLANELNASAQTGSSVDYKSVLTLISVNSDAVQGSLYDAMLGFTADNTTTAKWSYGVAFGRGDSTWPFNTSSTLIGSVAPGTGSRVANNGIDFSGVTFSGCAFKGPNSFCISPLSAIGTGAGTAFWTDQTPPGTPAISRIGSDRIYTGAAYNNATGSYATQGSIMTSSGWNWVERESDWLHISKIGRMAFSAYSQASMNTPINGYFGVATGTTVGGSGYTNGTYSNTPLTGGTGSGAAATIVVSGGSVTSVTITNVGIGYLVGDVLSASIPAGTGFTWTVSTIYAPIVIPLSGIAYNDVSTSGRQMPAWGGYFECLTNSGAGQCTGLEIDTDNKGISTGWNPYALPSHLDHISIGILNHCGGSHDASVTDCTLAMAIGANGASWKKGIGVGQYALASDAVVTITVASPAVVSWVGHGLSDGALVQFYTTGALPTGITAGTPYYVKSPTANSFNIAATPGGAAINTSGTQSGSHEAHAPVTGQSLTAIAPALYSVAGASLEWAKPDNSLGVRVVSLVTSTTGTNYQQILFKDHDMYFEVDGQPRLDLTSSGAIVPAILGTNNVTLNIFGQGTGNVCLGTSGTQCRWQVLASTAELSPFQDATFDFGSTTNRARDIYLSRNVVVGGATGFSGSKVAGACTLTISGGIITNVTGC